MSDSTCIDCHHCGLRGLCLPGRVVSEHQERLQQLRIRRGRATAGQWLFRPGESVFSLFAVRSGCVKEVTTPSYGASHTESIVGFTLPGEVLGLSNAGAARCLSGAQAVANSQYCEIPWSAFRQLCAESLQVSEELLQLLARATLISQQALTLMRGKDALAQVASFLCNLSERLAQRGLHAHEFRLSMTRLDIAHYLGLTAETVSRCFTELSKRGLIEVQAKYVRLLQHTGLQRLFDGETHLPAMAG